MNHTGLYLLPSLFYYTPDKDKEICDSIKYCWNNKYKNRITDKQINHAFGILNERVLKSKIKERISKMDFTFESSDGLNDKNDKIIELDDIEKKTYEHLNT